jgi:hypothetical protein
LTTERKASCFAHTRTRAEEEEEEEEEEPHTPANATLDELVPSQLGNPQGNADLEPPTVK